MANNLQDLEEPESGLRKFAALSCLRTVWKRKILVIASWIFLATCVVMVVRHLPSVYQAEAVVLIDSQKIPEKFVSAIVASELEDRISSIRQLILSGGELKKIIEDFGLYRELRKTRFEEDILETMRKDISITLDLEGPGGADKTKRPGAFRIGYQGSDPALVTRVANRLADLYVEQNLKTREGQAAGTSDFLDTQLRDAKKRLDEMEAQVSAYKLQHNGELPQQENVLTTTLTRLQTELEANRDAINRAHQAKVMLESSVAAMESNVAAQIRASDEAQHRGDTTDLVSLTGQGSNARKVKASGALEVQLAQLRAKFTDNHPDVIKVRTELENVKRIEAQQQASATDPEPAKQVASSQKPALPEPSELGHARNQLATLKAQIRGAESELANREAEQQRILRDLNTYQGRVERLPIREQQMAQITRDYEVSKENYKSLLDKKMAAGMSLDMERRQQSERFIVLDRAQIPEKPFKPEKLKLYAGGIAGSLALALLLGFAVELRRNVLLGEWELPPGTPVLARLPFIEVPIQQPPPKSAPRGWFSEKRELPRAAADGQSLLDRV